MIDITGMTFEERLDLHTKLSDTLRDRMASMVPVFQKWDLLPKNARPDVHEWYYDQQNGSIRIHYRDFFRGEEDWYEIAVPVEEFGWSLVALEGWAKIEADRRAEEKRLRDEKAMREAEARIEAREREQYERLKQKFGGS